MIFLRKKNRICQYCKFWEELKPRNYTWQDINIYLGICYFLGTGSITKNKEKCRAWKANHNNEIKEKFPTVRKAFNFVKYIIMYVWKKHFCKISH